jgi:hypothetical protein
VTEKRRGETPCLGWKYFDRDADPLLGQKLQQPQTRIRVSGARLTLLGRIRFWDLTFTSISTLTKFNSEIALLPVAADGKLPRRKFSAPYHDEKCFIHTYLSSVIIKLKSKKGGHHLMSVLLNSFPALVTWNLHIYILLGVKN